MIGPRPVRVRYAGTERCAKGAVFAPENDAFGTSNADPVPKARFPEKETPPLAQRSSCKLRPNAGAVIFSKSPGLKAHPRGIDAIMKGGSPIAC